MKKIVSFSLFVEDPKYSVGAEKNILLNQKMLPDWETYIYYHPQRILGGYVEKLKSLGGKMVNVENIYIGNKNSIQFPYFWRFLVFLENNTSIVRDLDSRLSKREVEYLKRWLDSNKEYNIIRDHPWHAPVPSGLFGIKGYKEQFRNHFSSFVEKSDLRWGTDQEILYEYMLNIEKQNVDYFGFDKLETYIPRDDKNFFIGMQLDENDNPTEPSGVQCLEFLNQLNL